MQDMRLGKAVKRCGCAQAGLACGIGITRSTLSRKICAGGTGFDRGETGGIARALRRNRAAVWHIIFSEIAAREG